MSMAYIRRTYGVPAMRGRRVEFWPYGKILSGTIVSARYGLLNVRAPDGKQWGPLHPTLCIRYLDDDGAVIWDGSR